MQLKAGTTSYTRFRIQFVDDTGLPLTGKVAANFPTVYYTGANAAAIAISLSDLSLITSAYSSGGIKEDTGSSGVYRLDIPDAVLASVGIPRIYGDASGKHVIQLGEVEVVAFDPADSVRMGMSALPNANPGTGSGICTGGAFSISGNILTFGGNTFLTSDPVGVTTLLGRLTATRAGYLDYAANLNIGGLVASAAAVLNITNNTFISSDVPPVLERPDSGSESVTITFIFRDGTGAAEDPDASANPTITLTDDAGNDVSGRLSSWNHAGTGEWNLTYTNSDTDALTTLRWRVSATIGAIQRVMVWRTQLVDTTAVDFTSSDRATLQGLATSAAAEASNLTTLLNRIGAFTGSGVNTVLGFFKALLSKTASTPSDVGGTFNPATDSVEAIRDRGDAAWLTPDLSTVTFTIRSPLINASTIKIAPGADYYHADGLALPFAWSIDATGGTLTLTAGSLTVTGTLLTGTTGYFEIPAAKSSLLPVRSRVPFHITAKLSDGHTVAVAEGTVITADFSAGGT